MVASTNPAASLEDVAQRAIRGYRDAVARAGAAEERADAAEERARAAEKRAAAAEARVGEVIGRRPDRLRRAA